MDGDIEIEMEITLWYGECEGKANLNGLSNISTDLAHLS